MIVVIDSGMGNVAAIVNMLHKGGHSSKSITNPEGLNEATHVILPGVGSFDNGKLRLQNSGFIPALEAARRRRCAVLGICLGMQLLTNRSDEGELPGLGWVAGETVRFDFDAEMRRKLKIPNMGWSDLEIRRQNSLFENLNEQARFYFVHSYRVRCNDAQDVVATAWHGHDFVAAFQRDNIFGVQFHPEKSHKFGMQLLDRFAKWRG